MKREAEYRDPRADRHHHAARPFEIILFGLAVYLTTTPFLFVLTGQDPNAPMLLNISTMQQENQSMLLVYVVRALVGLIGAVFMARRMREVRMGLGHLKSLLPFAVWAGLSSIWSDDPAVTLRSFMTLVVLWAGAYLAALRLSATDFARAIVVGGGMVGLTCLAYVFIHPAYAIHQLTDSSQFVHAGAWRGVYQHKNFLGHVAAFFAVAIFWADKSVIPWPPVKWSLVALLLFLVAKSTSASALPIVVITVAVVWILVVADPKARTKALIVLAPALVAVWWSTSMILVALGRDGSFSGRTVVWEVAMDTLMTRPLQGFGFVSISYGDFSYNMMRRAGVFDPHNAFFDIALGTGIIGLVLFLIILPFAWSAARKLYVIGGGERQVSLMLSSLVIGWMVSGMTEASSRPLTAMGGIGLFALAALLSVPRTKQGQGQGGTASNNPFAQMRMRAQQA